MENPLYDYLMLHTADETWYDFLEFDPEKSYSSKNEAFNGGMAAGEIEFARDLLLKFFGEKHPYGES